MPKFFLQGVESALTENGVGWQWQFTM